MKELRTKILFRFVYLFVLMVCLSCHKNNTKRTAEVKIAFIADIHLQDIYGEFTDNDYAGIKNPRTGEFTHIRTMSSQLQSTRIFNENYFAFLAALDDISEKGIKYVVLPGDFSDDGQPVHVRGLSKILKDYTKKHDLSFFVTTGNHDPTQPYTQSAKKNNFLGENGKEQIISSAQINLKELNSDQLQPVITADIEKWGYAPILNEMSSFGFHPKKDYLYWETPYSSYSYTNYSFKNAQKEAVLEKRTYTIKEDDNQIIDASYLVEPIEGVWLLAIDANVYLPKKKQPDSENEPTQFYGSSLGYINVLTHKNHLVNWVQKVTEQARENGKTLIAFSHYPMVDYNDDATSEMNTFFGADKMQLHRVPSKEVANTFADAGIKIHFGGHMHINDTGVLTTKKGNTLYNIQTPSLAAYIPAYKVLTITNNTEFEVETVVVDSVAGFNKLFPYYEQEHAYLKATKSNKLWDLSILSTTTYKEFTEWHLKELLRLRFIINDWPTNFSEAILKTSGKELLLKNGKQEVATINKDLSNQGWTLSTFDEWIGFDMLFDYYKLKNADELAISDIGEDRLNQYLYVCEHLSILDDPQFMLFYKIFQKATKGQPSNHFKINLKTETIKRLD